VVAPVLWFPVKAGRYGTYARVPWRETRHGIDIHHPRYPVIPKIGMNIAPTLLYRATRKFVRQLVEAYQIDLIDAHYFYPDGIAATRMAQELGIPVTVTARGTDLNLIPEYTKPRQQIIHAAQNADALITVCDALQAPLLEMGIDPKKITALRNGVDTSLFQLLPRDETRQKSGLTRRTLVSVGGLVERKGYHLTIEAMKALPDTVLLIAGEGEERGALEQQIKGAGLSDRVRLLGQVPHADLPSLYSAANASVLASSREGWANVLLEAMACGTPVVATDIWGTGEVVTAPEAGLLIPDRSADAIAGGVERLFSSLPDRSATRAYAEKFTWEPTTQGQLALFRQLTDSRQ
jgi:teichuronic acid biosynthesis glycosyltransferase TuaC